MGRVFVGVGSNIDPESSVAGALKLLGRLVPIVAVSTFYKTEPIDSPGTPEYINGVVELCTDMPPVELKFSVLRSVEERLGRVRSEDRFSPRTIDLDLLLYGVAVMDEEGLKLPDPDITERLFILLPLYELYPELLLPGAGVDIAELVREIKKSNAYKSEPGMEALVEFSRRLRVELGL